MWPVIALLACLNCPAEVPFTCGTGAFSAAQERRIENIRARRDTRAQQRAAIKAEVHDGIVIVDATPENALFRRRFDLDQKSLRFTPAGADAFTTDVIPLAASGDRGVQLTLAGAPPFTTFKLTKFAFPFGGRSLQELYIGRDLSIRTQPPAAIPAEFMQYDALEAALQREPLIAPMLLVERSFFSNVYVWVRERVDDVTITWTNAVPGGFAGTYDIRATLHRDGTITFSYVSGTWNSGAVVVTTGSVPLLNELTTLGTAPDAANDIEAHFPAAIRGPGEILNVAVSRAGAIDLLRFQIDVAAALEPLVAMDAQVSFRVEEDERTLFLVQVGNGTIALDLGRPTSQDWPPPPTPAVQIDGTRLIVWLTEDLLPMQADAKLKVHSYGVLANHGYTGDEASVATTWRPSAEHLNRDFSVLTSPATLRTPLVEAFVLPTLDPRQVWADVKEATGWTDRWDGVAIYQNFETDLALTGVSGYATAGFANVDGIGRTGWPRRGPTLMHLSRAGTVRPPSSVRQNILTLHEFGHRWLSSINLTVNGEEMLAPDGAHPAQWVDTRAAFRVYDNDACSPMGGAYFDDLGGGNFRSGSRTTYGYSWLDLYAMGLAPAEEVPAMFYLAETSPALGFAYWAPPRREYRGTRRDVSISQLIAANGPRRPAHADAPRTFHVAFVLVREPEREVTGGELDYVDWQRDTFVREFALQTGGRGKIELTPAPPVKRRAIRH